MEPVIKYYAPISKKEFVSKLKNKTGRNNEDSLYNILEHTARTNSSIDFPDLKHIHFDLENMWFQFKYGYSHQFSPYGYSIGIINPSLNSDDEFFNAMHVVAGGDWELPVCFLIYWDGIKFRGHIPIKGNVFNPVSNTAFGSERMRSLDPEEAMAVGLVLKLKESGLSDSKIEEIGEIDMDTAFTYISNMEVIADECDEVFKRMP